VNHEQTATVSPEQNLSATLELVAHLFEDQAGYLNTFTGQQARFSNPTARPNELADVVNRSWEYPGQAAKAVKYLNRECNRQRDAYFGVHLYEAYQPGRRLAANAVEFVRALWVDGDGAQVPPEWPQPTAIVRSSEGREHFYWGLDTLVPAADAVKLNRRMAVVMGADRGKAGLSTVLRAPGTSNFKRESPELVTLEIAGGRLDPKEIEAAVPESTQGTQQTRRHRRTTKRPPWARDNRGRKFDLVEWMNHHGVPYGPEVQDGKGRKWRLLECPIAPPRKEHSDGVYIGYHASGAPWFQCYHDHGEGFVWQDFRPIFEPGCYIPWWVKVVAKNA
jgi:hypothetical protein